MDPDQSVGEKNQPRVPPRRDWVFAFASILPVVTLLLILEGLLALCGVKNPVRYREVASPDLFAHDDTLGWVLRPNARGTHTAPEYSVIYSIDDRGLRRTPASREGVRARIWCLGGSMTFGHGVNDEETMPNRLSELTGSQVWNLGVQAYGTDQSLLQLRRMLKTALPDIVILSYLPSNLERNACLPKWTQKLKQSHRTKPRFRMIDGTLRLVEIPGSANIAGISQLEPGVGVIQTPLHGFFLTCGNG